MHWSESLPKPAFKNCDETSLSLQWSPLTPDPNYRVTLQFKKVFQPWEEMKEKEVSHAAEISLRETDIVDLEPGTPYSVRLAAYNLLDGAVRPGPEVVFDTKPVDCTPKRKRCVVC